MVNRFKDEIQGLERRTELVFPTPVPEGKIPGGAVILLSLLLVGVAYGGWLYLSDQGRTVADLIPEVPDRLQGLIGPQITSDLAEDAGRNSEAGRGDIVADDRPAGSRAQSDDQMAQASGRGLSEPVFTPAATAMAAPSFADEPETADSVTSGSLTGTGEATDGSSNEAGQSLVGETLALATSPDEQTGPANGAVERTETLGSLAEVIAGKRTRGEGRGAAQVDLSEGAGAPRRTRDELPAGSEIAVDSAIGTVTSAERGTSDIPQAPSTAQLALSQAGNPRTYGSDNENARIVLRARHDSWVQVRDGQDELLLTRVLRAGDSYRVPNQRGLTLLTGNAGGLEIEVDGETLAPLGPLGSVRRNIALDPRSLVTGTANP